MSGLESGCGRYAPSPTGDFHLGNLRTALIAWLCARAQAQRFVLRIEDLDPDRSRLLYERSQLDDLRALGIDWDDAPERQSERHELYAAAFERLRAAGLAYRCFCSRRDIAEAAGAPHEQGAEIPYPGTCSGLSESDARNRAESGAEHSWRIRAEAAEVSFLDITHGELSAPVDDFVLVRRDGTFSYHLAVVVDDDAQAVSEVVRGEDLLLPTTARHALLYDLLELRRPSWRHVPLVLGADGIRLAKRDGALTRSGLHRLGRNDAELFDALARSLGLAAPAHSSAAGLLEQFDPGALPADPVALPAGDDPLAAAWTRAPRPRRA